MLGNEDTQGLEAMEAEYRRQMFEDVRLHTKELAIEEMEGIIHRQLSEFHHMLAANIKTQVRTALTEFADAITEDLYRHFAMMQNHLEKVTRAMLSVRPSELELPERTQAPATNTWQDTNVVQPDQKSSLREQTIQAPETSQAETGTPIITTREPEITGIDVSYMDQDRKQEDTATKLFKPSFAEDVDLDVSQVVLKESQSFANIFQVDTDLCKIPYNVEDKYEDGWVKDIILSPCFQYTTLCVIILNVIYLAVEADMNDASNLYEAGWEFIIAEQFFCIYFSFEVVLRFRAFSHKRDSIQDGWFKFDFFLMATMVLEIWVLMPILYILRTEGGSSTSFQLPTQPLRVVRLLKLARMARLMRAIPELVTMINALLQALRAIFSTMILVLLMVYAWSIFILTFMKDEKEYNEHLKKEYSLHFGGFLPCMWSLLVAGTLMLDNTGLVMTELVFSGNGVYVCTGIAFIIYSFLSALLVLQMLIGVLCDVVGQVASDRRNADSIGLMKQELLGDLMDKDAGDGQISREELLAVFESESSKAVFKRLNINRLFLTSLASLMFRDKSTLVPIKTVLELMIMCKGDNTATVQIIASVLCCLSDEIAHLHDNMHVNFNVLNGNLAQVEHRTNLFAAPEFHENFDVDEPEKHTMLGSELLSRKLHHMQEKLGHMQERLGLHLPTTRSHKAKPENRSSGPDGSESHASSSMQNLQNSHVERKSSRRSSN